VIRESPDWPIKRVFSCSGRPKSASSLLGVWFIGLERVTVTKALFVWLEAKPGDGDRVEDFLVWVWMLAEKEADVRP